MSAAQASAAWQPIVTHFSPGISNVGNTFRLIQASRGETRLNPSPATHAAAAHPRAPSQLALTSPCEDELLQSAGSVLASSESFNATSPGPDALLCRTEGPEHIFIESPEA